MHGQYNNTEQCVSECQRLNFFRGAVESLLVSQYAVWAEQWAYQPPWELTSLNPGWDFSWSFKLVFTINLNL